MTEKAADAKFSVGQEGANYIELHARSAFSFLRGSSSPEHLVFTAAELHLPALALCDRDGVFGAPRFYATARERGIRPIVGSELTMEDGSVLPVLVQSRNGYQNLCRLLSRARLRSPKNESSIRGSELSYFKEGLICLTGEEEGPLHQALLTGDFSRADQCLASLKEIFGVNRLFVEIQRHALRTEQRLNQRLCELADRHRLKLLATNGVLYGTSDRRTALDVFTCARNHTHLDAAGRFLEPNMERHLKPAIKMSALFPDLPHAVANTVAVANDIEFTLENLGYEFPKFPVPQGETMDSFLEKVVWAGARYRYGKISGRVRSQIEHELALIRKLGFPGYFLIVWDLIRYCRESNIMVQGRGSAANSAVCYSLDITAVDPIGGKLLFERFLSEGRKGWPDIDLDLPSGDRREQVIQEVYRRYGRLGAAMTANVITFRGRSAMRETSKALNLPEDIMDRFSRLYANGDFPHTLEPHDQVRQAGLPADHPRVNAFLQVYHAIQGLPRHLGQHSGGMVICEGQLDAIVPLENATMPGRTVIQWDKDDCEDLGIVKVDLLGLGMMAALQDAIEICDQRGHPVDLAKLPKDDPATYDMLCRAETIGVFQVESRAQMATLPRLQPKEFYDLVIEVAIVRPGPIQGDMVHPYLRRRQGIDEVAYPSPSPAHGDKDELKKVLARTLGVPLFQEQAMKIAMVAAKFSAAEADKLRRAMATFKRVGTIGLFQVKMIEGMVARGYDREFAEHCFHQIEGFGEYGFPESHAASFALLVYASAWIKCHYPDVFCAALLNAQPMGFYAPAQIVRDVREHGVEVRAVDVNCSAYDAPLEGGGGEQVSPPRGGGRACRRGEATRWHGASGAFAHPPSDPCRHGGRHPLHP